MKRPLPSLFMMNGKLERHDGAPEAQDRIIVVNKAGERWHCLPDKPVNLPPNGSSVEVETRFGIRGDLRFILYCTDIKPARN